MAVGFPTKVNYATGDVLSAQNMNDLSGTVNLLESAQYAAGKNKIINGDFGVWQRGTSFTPADGAYTSDRWVVAYNGSGATRTISQQTFTPGTAPVAGYEGTFFYRYAQSVAGTAGTYNQLVQRIEDVRQFAGQTVTISFWAKAAATTSLPDAGFEQFFGSGGSGDVAVFNGVAQSITTSWQRFSYTVAVPSISGKTIGTNSYLKFIIKLPLNATFTLDFWGVQLEAASTASPFQTATGTKQGELAACQRYYYRIQGQSSVAMGIGSGYATSTTSFRSTIRVPVTFRNTPTFTSSAVGASSAFHTIVGSTQVYSDSLSANLLGVDGNGLTQTTSGITTGQGGEIFIDSGKTTSYLEWSAEL
jgi:hypothetical protein